MKKILLTLVIGIIGCQMLSAQTSSTAELRSLVAPGNKVAIEFFDRTYDFDEEDRFIRSYLREWSDWVVVDEPTQADFILYVEGRSAHVAKNTPTSKSYYMTPTIRRKDGTDVWKGETVCDWACPGNGSRAVKGVSWQLVRTLIQALRQELGGSPVFVEV